MKIMEIFCFLILAILLSSCSENKNNDKKEKTDDSKQLIKSELQSILDSSGVMGSILVYDFQKDIYYSNNFDWAKKGKLPASTFKIVNLIIALESGVVDNDSTISKWDGKKRWLKKWEQNLSFMDAFHFSCVPCFQEVARKVGIKRINEYLNKLDYGNMVLDSNNIDVFWLEGNSRISQFQQIDFLTRFYDSKLPISKRTHEIMKRIMVIEDSGNYIVSGKTGWSNSNDTNNGWFVGYIELENKTYFFATNIEPKQQFNMNFFPMIRKTITFKAFQELDIFNHEKN